MQSQLWSKELRVECVERGRVWSEELHVECVNPIKNTFHDLACIVHDTEVVCGVVDYLWWSEAPRVECVEWGCV